VFSPAYILPDNVDISVAGRVKCGHSDTGNEETSSACSSDSDDAQSTRPTDAYSAAAANKRKQEITDGLFHNRFLFTSSLHVTLALYTLFLLTYLSSTLQLSSTIKQ